MSILLTHQNSLAFGMLHVVQNTFYTKFIRYDLNSIIPKNKNLNHNDNEIKKKSSKTQNHKFCYSNLQFSSRV